MNNQTVIRIKSAEIELIEDKVVKITTASNYESNIEDVKEIGEVMNTLIGNNPHYILVITQQGASATPDAREYAANSSYRRNVIAEGIVIKNLALRMAATVYMKVNRPKQKIKLFNSEAKALTWIRKLKSKEA
jgi:hypothetical protein